MTQNKKNVLKIKTFYLVQNRPIFREQSIEYLQTNHIDYTFEIILIQKEYVLLLEGVELLSNNL